MPLLYFELHLYSLKTYEWIVVMIIVVLKNHRRKMWTKLSFVLYVGFVVLCCSFQQIFWPMLRNGKKYQINNIDYCISMAILTPPLFHLFVELLYFFFGIMLLLFLLLEYRTDAINIENWKYLISVLQGFNKNRNNDDLHNFYTEFIY